MRMSPTNIEIVPSDLRALIFWASVGVSKSRGGYQEHNIEHIVESYAEALTFKLPKRCRFMRRKEGCGQ